MKSRRRRRRRRNSIDKTTKEWLLKKNKNINEHSKL